MRSTVVRRAAHAHKPMIKFLGKRKTPESVDHAPHVHPAAPTNSLPESFASYRSKAQQHGPLGGTNEGPSHASSTGSSSAPRPTSVAVPSMTPYGAIGGNPGRSLGPVKPKEGEYFDRSELPKRFQRMTWTEAEIEAISSGGASMWN